MAFGFTLGLPAADISFHRTWACSHALQPGRVASSLSINTLGRVQRGCRCRWENAGVKSLFEQSEWRRLFAFPPICVKCGLLGPKEGPRQSHICVATLHHCRCVAVHTSVFALPTFLFPCKPVSNGVGTWDDPWEQPGVGKSESPADEQC